MPIPNFDIDNVIERSQRKQRRKILMVAIGATLVLIFLIARGAP